MRLTAAASAQVFAPPSQGPLVQTANYTSFSNNTPKDKPICKGKVFNQIIQIWLENTDFTSLTISVVRSDDGLDAHLRVPRGAGHTPNQLQPCDTPLPHIVIWHPTTSPPPQSPTRTSSASTIRMFNDFANDVVNGTLPQWVFVTPNMMHLTSLSLPPAPLHIPSSILLNVVRLKR
ncbi:hypothetical protein B0H13DRAFT_1866384 [Mycena leptocephala]|nr:hypothetical protein B0H13DRAFT_1866384 [Mycena leptocephala]